MSTPTKTMDPRQKPLVNLNKVAKTLQKKFDKARTLGRIEGSIASIDSLLILTKYFEENRGDPRTHQVYRHWLLVEKGNLQNKAKNICLEHEILPNPPPPISPEPQPPVVAVPTIKRSGKVDKPTNVRKRQTNGANRVKKPAKKKVVIQTPPPPSPTPSPSPSESDTESDRAPLPPPTVGVRRSQRTLTVAARQPKVKEKSVKKNKGKGKPVAKPVKKVTKSILKKVIPEVVPEVNPVKRVGLRLTYKAGGFM